MTAYCTIAAGTIRKENAVLFEDNTPLEDFLPAAYHKFGFSYPKFHKMDNLGKLGWLAAEVLLDGRNITQDIEPEDVAIILANANSSLDDDLKYYATANDIASPSLFVYTLPNIVMGEISIRHKLKGEQAFFINETFDAQFIAGQVNYLLDHHKAACCICGWVDVLGDEYKAVLFLAEKQKNENAVLFSAEEMERVYQSVK